MNSMSKGAVVNKPSEFDIDKRTLDTTLNRFHIPFDVPKKHKERTSLHEKLKALGVKDGTGL